ncbi:MAG: hypothetical protein ACI9CU_002620 [Polaribacter sp.]|jgi:hypothetical protein
MKKVTDIVFGFTSRQPVIFLVVGFWLLVNGLFLPLQLKLKSLSGTMIPDVVLGLNAEKLSEIFDAYGAEGMEIYRQVGFYDIFIPFSYAAFFGSLIYLLYSNSIIKLLSWAPVVAAILDYIENYQFNIITADISVLDPETVSLTGNVVTVKLVFLALSMTTILVGTVNKFILKKHS